MFQRDWNKSNSNSSIAGSSKIEEFSLTLLGSECVSLVSTNCVEKLRLHAGAGLADSLLLAGGDSADDGRAAGDAGRAVLRVLPGAARPRDHLLRAIDRFVDLRGPGAPGAVLQRVGRPSIDPELMIRMLIVGYCLGIRSERRLCEEVHLNLAYRWFCRLGWTATCPTTRPSPRTATAASATATCCASSSRPWCERCMAEGLVGGEGFAVDASIIAADAHRRRSVAKVETWSFDFEPRSRRISVGP